MEHASTLCQQGGRFIWNRNKIDVNNAEKSLKWHQPRGKSFLNLIRLICPFFPLLAFETLCMSQLLFFFLLIQSACNFISLVRKKEKHIQLAIKSPLINFLSPWIATKHLLLWMLQLSKYRVQKVNLQTCLKAGGDKTDTREGQLRKETALWHPDISFHLQTPSSWDVRNNTKTRVKVPLLRCMIQQWPWLSVRRLITASTFQILHTNTHPGRGNGNMGSLSRGSPSCWLEWH